MLKTGSPRRLAGTCLCGLALAAGGASSQQLEPRSYANVPVGMNFLIAGYAYATGGYAADPALPLVDAHLKLQTPVVAYARSLDAWGKSAKIDAIVAGGCVSGSALFAGAPVSRDVCGLLDPAVRFSMNFYGAPAMSLEQFRSYQPDLVVGGSLQVQAPLGQYDPSRLVNLSTNRWTFRPELGVSKTLKPFTVEVALGASLYTTNDNYYGGKTREQDPIYNTQLHLIYEFPGGMWAALNATYYTGGRTTVDGVTNNDELDNSRAGLTLAFPLNRQDSVKLYASRGISTRTGTSFDLLGVAWQHRWGAGL